MALKFGEYHFATVLLKSTTSRQDPQFSFCSFVSDFFVWASSISAANQNASTLDTIDQTFSSPFFKHRRQSLLENWSDLSPWSIHLFFISIFRFSFFFSFQIGSTWGGLHPNADTFWRIILISLHLLTF